MKEMNQEITLPKMWDDLSLRPYLGEVSRRHGIIESIALPSMHDLPPVRIESLFVSPLLAEILVSADSEPVSWPEGKSLLVMLQEYPQLVVLGDPGGGKTTLSNWLAWRLSIGLTTPLPPVLEGRIPLPCVLREMSPAVFSPELTLPELAVKIAEKILGNKATDALKTCLRARVAAGNYVLILDGVDEIPVPHRKIVGDWVQQAAGQGAVVLATSRIVGYEDGPVHRSISSTAKDITEFRKLLLDEPNKDAGSETKELTPSKWEFLKQAALKTRESNLEMLDLLQEPLIWAQLRYLMPFDQYRIVAFAENWYRQRCSSEQEARQKASDLLAALAQSEVTRQLARTPNLLSLMAIVHRERSHLPDGKALLYDDITNAYINTIDKQRKITPMDATLAKYDWKDRRAWLAYVGFQMQQLRDGKNNESEKSDGGVLADEDEVLAWLADAMRLSKVDQPEQAARTFLGWVARRSGLLLPRGEGRYAFVHLSFQEYFCACYLNSRIVNLAFIRDKVKADDPVTKEKLTNWSQNNIWRETLVFLFELLSAERGADWVEDLAEILFKSEESQLKGAQAALAGRVLVDQHILLGDDWKGRLADRSISQAMQDWLARKYESEMIILPTLLNAGYAAIVAAPLSTSIEALDQSLKISEFDNLQEIKNKNRLRICIVTNNNIIDLQPLAACINLQAIDVSHTQVMDATSLAGLKKLQILDLSNSQISDITSISELNNLRELNLNHLRVKNISVLSRLTSLESLNLIRTKVVNITPLANLKNLRALDLTGTKVTDLKPLKELINLQMLSINGTKVEDISPLDGLDKLQMLSLHHTNVKNINPLINLKNLINLDLGNTMVDDITSLAELKDMKFLDLNTTLVRDVKSLSALNKLMILELHHTKVADVTPLAGLKRLIILRLNDTEIENIAPLAELENLSVLNLSQTKVTDIAPFAVLNKLHRLDISNTQVTDVTPLDGLKNLEVAGVHATKKKTGLARKLRKPPKKSTS